MRNRAQHNLEEKVMDTATASRNTTQRGHAVRAEVDQTDKFVSVRQAADLLHLSEASVRRFLTQKKLRRFKAGGARTLLLRAEVVALIRPAA